MWEKMGLWGGGGWKPPEQVKRFTIVSAPDFPTVVPAVALAWSPTARVELDSEDAEAEAEAEALTANMLGNAIAPNVGAALMAV